MIEESSNPGLPPQRRTEEVAAGSSELPDGVVYTPELRWLVDPNDLAKPMVFDPDDSALVQWRKGQPHQEVLQRLTEARVRKPGRALWDIARRR